MLRYPKKKEIKTKLFTAEKSPLVFSNRITYEIKGNSRIVENDFFVSGITNYPESEFFEWKYYESCAEFLDMQSAQKMLKNHLLNLVFQH